MSIEELMKPRYKVIAAIWCYKNNKLQPPPVGTMLTFDVESVDILYPDGETDLTSSYIYSHPHINRYPHLFRRLEWWEERQPSEMPEYVKINNCGIEKVYRWVDDNFRLYIANEVTVLTKFCQPATAAEYNTHHSKP